MKSKKITILFAILSCIQPLLWYFVYVACYPMAKTLDQIKGLGSACIASAFISVIICIVISANNADLD